MKKKDVLSKIYSEPQILTNQSYQQLVEDKDQEQLLIKTHYFICEILEDFDIENLEDNISESYLLIYEFLNSQNLPKTKKEYLDKVSKYVVEKLLEKEAEAKEHNQDLNFDKRVNLQNVEQEIDSKSDIESSTVLKMDFEDVLKENIKLREKPPRKHKAARKQAKIFAEFNGIIGNEQKSAKELSRKYKICTGQVTNINRKYFRILKHPHYGLYEYNDKLKEKMIKNKIIFERDK